MNKYFVAGNVWLFTSVTLFLGQTVARTQPLMYSFFGVGAWMYPLAYHGLITFCMSAAIVCFLLMWVGSKRAGKREHVYSELS